MRAFHEENEEIRVIIRMLKYFIGKVLALKKIDIHQQDDGFCGIT